MQRPLNLEGVAAEVRKNRSRYSDYQNADFEGKIKVAIADICNKSARWADST